MLAIPGQVAVGLIQPALGLFWPWSGAPNENIVQNHLNIALLNVF